MTKHKPPQQKAPAQQQHGATQEKQSHAALTQPDQGQPPTSDKDRDAEQGKQWRWGQLYPQWALVIISLLAVFAAGVTLLILKSTLDATKQAADAATNQSQTATEDMKRSHRPWAYITGDVMATKPLSFNSGTNVAEAWFSSQIKNSGSSPAINAMIQSTLSVGADINALIAKTRITPACDRNFIEQATKILGFFVAPADSVTEPTGETHTTSPFPKVGPVSVLLQLCVGYRDEFGISHGTGLSWQYVTPGKTDSSLNPEGVVPGKWQFFGVNSVAY